MNKACTKGHGEMPRAKRLSDGGALYQRRSLLVPEPRLVDLVSAKCCYHAPTDCASFGPSFALPLVPDTVLMVQQLPRRTRGRFLAEGSSWRYAAKKQKRVPTLTGFATAQMFQEKSGSTFPNHMELFGLGLFEFFDDF